MNTGMIYPYAKAATVAVFAKLLNRFALFTACAVVAAACDAANPVVTLPYVLAN